MVWWWGGIVLYGVLGCVFGGGVYGCCFCWGCVFAFVLGFLFCGRYGVVVWCGVVLLVVVCFGVGGVLLLGPNGLWN